MTSSGIGASVKRKEDDRFISGKGKYTADVNLYNQTYAYFIRSPHAHAKIKKIDISKATKTPGVLGVFTGEDVKKDKIGNLICGWKIMSKDGSEMQVPPHPILAQGKANHVGEQVAVVIAETLEIAKNAAEKVLIDYEILKAVVSTANAMEGKQIYDNVKNNCAFDFELGDKKKADESFSGAEHIVSLDLINNRLVPNAMEPRAATAEYNSGTGEYTLYTTSQNPHLSRLIMSAFLQVAPEHKLRLIAPDVGGGFGSKIYLYAEETVVTWATKKIGRPIKWVCDRSESFLTDCHGRDHVTKAELAVKKDGTMLGIKVHTIANVGAYLSTFASVTPTYLYAPLIIGTYNIPAAYCNVKAVVTNTAPVDAYRGAGRPEASYLIERLVETAARELNIDPADLRKKNFVDKFPHQTCLIHLYDSGNYKAHLDKAMELSDYKNFNQRKAESKKRGKLRGVGFSSYIEACGIAPSAAVLSLGAGVGLWESAQVRFNPTGNVTVFTGAHSHGQGHDTTFSQIVSDRLGIPFENIEVIHGDTDKGPFGMGTYGSRSLAVGGSAIAKSCDKLIAKGKKISAKMLDVSENDIEFKDGHFEAKGTNKKKSIGEVAFASYLPGEYGKINSPLPEGVEPGFNETSFFDPANFSFPSGTHICEVEVDPDTGVTKIVKYIAIDDFGTIINPMIVEGQVHGGVAQGAGQALTEHTVYDDNGQLITGSYMDYTMPRADMLPNMQLAFTNTPSPMNPLGVKGCGEAGAIGSPPAIMNAVTDAINSNDLQMPATPVRVWEALKRKVA